MSFNGNESSVISKQNAIDWNANYRNTISSTEVRAHFFGKNKLKLILDQDDCVGIRAYYAIDETGAKQLVLVGVKSDEQDLFNGVILDRSVPCPHDCSSASPLSQ